MFSQIDLKKLSEISTPDRSFLTLVLPHTYSMKNLEKRFDKIRNALKTHETEKDELDYFNENVKLVAKYLEDHSFKSGSICIFANWIADLFQVHTIPSDMDELIWIDSSPYIRPLAELQDDYENVLVVITDNKKARIFMISSMISEDETVIHGHIKNHVRKGGWSQQRYERRRDKQLLHYAKDIADAVHEISKTDVFHRIILVGGKEILQIVMDHLPPHFRDMVNKKALDLGKSEDIIHHDIMALFDEQERQSEQDLWEEIRQEYLKGGLGIVGLENVLAAVKIGQVDRAIVNRDFKPMGKRCRKCEHLEIESVDQCSKCQSDSLFDVDVVNEIVELLKLSGGEIEFTDPIDTLSSAGNIAAKLRYKI
ncbi:Vms1/Ankzf1 family peptidyl-tRNA hydrolase [bacterium]